MRMQEAGLPISVDEIQRNPRKPEASSQTNKCLKFPQQISLVEVKAKCHLLTDLVGHIHQRQGDMTGQSGG